ncbi:MAG: T9SS type A sorting domain-containing protein, partial [Calditrichota bacterium]
TSGIVFLDCTSSGAYAASEGHRRWSQGLLYDNHIELDGPRSGVNPRLIGLYNRGYFGTSHGWSAVHSVAWNCDVKNGEIHVQQPPTGQNYAIGCFGTVTGQRPPCSFDVPEGYIEGSNTPGLNPRSLFLAQLEDRGIIVGVEPKGQGSVLINEFTLSQNYPNPFNPSTSIQVYLSRPVSAGIRIYNSVGQLVEEITPRLLQTGPHDFQWEASRFASGIYYYSLVIEGQAVQHKKALLLK